MGGLEIVEHGSIVKQEEEFTILFGVSMARSSVE
jgi:hypothetical protein